MRILLKKQFKILILASLLVIPAAPVSADPLGYLVNKVMEAIIDASNKKPQSAPVSNPSRTIPNDSETGYLSPPTNGNQLEIDGDDYILAFNSRIRDEGNRIIQTGMIHQEKRIRYTLNNQEQVDKIWLLAPGEL